MDIRYIKLDKDALDDIRNMVRECIDQEIISDLKRIKQMSEVYIVLEVGYEYNDENYYQPECGSLTPKRAFASRDQAVEVARELTRKAFLGAYDLTSYIGYDGEGLRVPASEANERLKALTGLDQCLEEYNLNLPAKINDELLDALMDIFDVEFYRVERMDVE